MEIGHWLIVLVGTALANVVILFAGLIPLQLVCSLLLLCFLPGYTLTFLLFPKTDPPSLLERVVFAFGIGYALLVVGGLAIHYLPGAITPRLVLLAYDALILVFAIASFAARLRRRGEAIGNLPQVSSQPAGGFMEAPKLGSGNGSVIAVSTSKWQVVLIVVLASFFRLTSLGYAEFQDDEAKVVLKAAGAIQGRDDVLFLHKKGPAEILIPTMFYSLMGQTNEFAARLPFALANLLGIVVVYLIGREMFNDSVGLAAALLLSINGYFVAFSRIVQYQSIVFLMTALSVLCYYRFYREEANGRPYAVSEAALGALFLVVGLLAHYDAVFAAPVIAYLCLRKYRQRPSCFKGDLPSLLVSSIIVLCLLATFYVPLMRHPYWGEIQTYLKTRTVAGGAIFHNNLNDFFDLSTVYNSTYYIISLILLFVVFLVILLVFRPPSPEVKASLLWFAVPFLVYAFLFASPRTHFYVSFPAWAIMGGVALDRVWKLEVGGWKLAFAVLYVICAYYIFFVFVQHDPEYTRTYPEHRNRYYWTFYGDEFPQQQGWFGFPYRAGWKVVGYLYETDVLKGDYDSNEESFITRWYTRGELRCSYNPHYYFVAENVQDEQWIPLEKIEEDYGLTGVVLVDNEPKLRIYEHGRANLSQTTTYRVEDYEPLYGGKARDSETTSPDFDAGIPTHDPSSLIQHPLEVSLENERRTSRIKLLGYDLDSTRIKRGDALLLTLYWQGSEKLEEDYKVFVHLETDHIWGQEDHAPACGTRPTTTWAPGEVIVDRYSLLIAPHTPAGSYPILVGLYEPSTGRRMKIFNEQGEASGDAIPLSEVTVIP